MIIQSKKVWIADQFVPAAIEVKEGKIVGIFPYGTKDVDDDYGDKRIVPGFMDIHCHGAYELLGRTYRFGGRDQLSGYHHHPER